MNIFDEITRYIARSRRTIEKNALDAIAIMT